MSQGEGPGWRGARKRPVGRALARWREGEAERRKRAVGPGNGRGNRHGEARGRWAGRRGAAALGRSRRFSFPRAGPGLTRPGGGRGARGRWRPLVRAGGPSRVGPGAAPAAGRQLGPAMGTEGRGQEARAAARREAASWGLGATAATAEHPNACLASDRLLGRSQNRIGLTFAAGKRCDDANQASSLFREAARPLHPSAGRFAFQGPQP